MDPYRQSGTYVPPEYFLETCADVEAPSQSLFMFQLIGALSIAYGTREYLLANHPEMYRRGVAKVTEIGLNAGFGAAWAVMQAETQVKRGLRAAGKIASATLIAPFRDLISPPSEPKDYLFIKDGKVVERAPLSNLIHYKSSPCDFGIYAISNDNAGAAVRINECHDLYDGDFTFSTSRALSVSLTVGDEKTDVPTNVVVDGNKLSPFVAGNRLYDVDWFKWTLGRDLSDKEYRVLIMDNNVETIEFISSPERPMWIEVTHDSLEITSGLQNGSDCSSDDEKTADEHEASSEAGTSDTSIDPNAGWWSRWTGRS